MCRRKKQLKITYSNVEPMMYNNILYADSKVKIDYAERNKSYQALKSALKMFNIEIPNTIDAHSVLWLLNELYLKMNRIELLDFMDHLEGNNLEIFGNMTKGE